MPKITPNNICPLVGPKYPLFVPVHPSKSQPKWREWGRKPAQILTLADSSSASYLRAREAAARRDEHRRYDDSDGSYPKIINPFMREDV